MKESKNAKERRTLNLKRFETFLTLQFAHRLAMLLMSPTQSVMQWMLILLAEVTRTPTLCLVKNMIHIEITDLLGDSPCGTWVRLIAYFSQISNFQLAHPTIVIQITKLETKIWVASQEAPYLMSYHDEDTLSRFILLVNHGITRKPPFGLRFK